MDVSLNEQHMNLNDVMKNLPGLTNRERYKAAGLPACDHEELIVVFFSIAGEEKESRVKNMLTDEL